MKLTAALFLSPLLASALFLSSSSKDERKALDANFPVPGKNPLFYCKDPSDYIGQIEFVDLEPNPPVPGQKLTVKANGTFTKDIEEGATVFLQVKYGLITLIKTEQSLCDNLPKIDLECPLKEGVLSITKEVDIPKQVPPGKYTVLAHALTADKEDITCLESTVVFSRS